MQRNVRAFIEAVKKDMAHLSDRINKELSEVVLSSTNAPGFPLNGEFISADSKITTRELSTS
jgi:large subunit ribosomal protein L1